MSGVVAAALCAGGGLSLAAFGTWAIKTHEPGGNETVFMRAWSLRSLAYSGGWIILFMGLFLAAIVAPMIYLSR